MKTNSISDIQQAHSLTESIRLQRETLKHILSTPMANLAQTCAKTNMQENELEVLLISGLPSIISCKHLFILDPEFVQITKNITPDGLDASQRGRDRKGRPYTVNIDGQTLFKLSEAYISHRAKRPSLTAMQIIQNSEGKTLGYLGADFDMRELPHTENCYHEPDNWHQLKGDPAIRRNLFLQQRTTSIMDDNIDEALNTLLELMTVYGVYHGEIFFSHSRAIVWHQDDPFNYHLLTLNELMTPNILLAYPKRDYLDCATVPIDTIQSIFEIFKQLRFADNNVYLRSASLNIANAMIGLNFSCDGSHYMCFDEFLEKNTDFWFGEGMRKTNT